MIASAVEEDIGRIVGANGRHILVTPACWKLLPSLDEFELQ
jgi:hypothetical protein